MHLSDDKLISARDGSLTGDGGEHLKTCKSCQSRLDALVGLRGKLNELPLISMPSDQWDTIKQQHQIDRTKQALEHSKNRSRFWQFSSFALAASFAGFFVAFIFLGESQIPNGSSIERKVAGLIEENNQLQKVLKNQNSKKQYYLATVHSYEMELEKIDKELQIAYIEGASPEAKVKLWMARKLLIKDIIDELSKKQSNTTIFI
jgi:hypothetical protein